MNDLHRSLAPIGPEAWAEIEDEARGALTATIAGRRLVEFVGPIGWQTSAVDLGRTTSLPARPDGGSARLRRVQPLLELRFTFELERREVEALARGAKDPDLATVVAAARAAALAEDRAIFSGDADAGIVGIVSGAENDPIGLSNDYTRYPEAVAEAMRVLRDNGVAGPWALAVGPQCYAGLTATTHSGGYPVFEHVKTLVDGPVVFAPALDGSVLLSLRGGDFELTVGRDFSLGYLAHDADRVTLYIESSFTFLNNAPEAAVPLVYSASGGGHTA